MSDCESSRRTVFCQAFSRLALNMSCRVIQHAWQVLPTQSHLGRARRSRTTRQQSPHWLQWTPQIHPRPAPSHSTIIPLPSNTPIPRSTPLTTPYGIGIQSAVFPQYTFQSDRQTVLQIHRQADRQTDRQTDRPRHEIGDRSAREGLGPTLYYIYRAY